VRPGKPQRRHVPGAIPSLSRGRAVNVPLPADAWRENRQPVLGDGSGMGRSGLTSCENFRRPLIRLLWPKAAVMPETQGHVPERQSPNFAFTPISSASSTQKSPSGFFLLAFKGFKLAWLSRNIILMQLLEVLRNLWLRRIARELVRVLIPGDMWSVSRFEVWHFICRWNSNGDYGTSERKKPKRTAH